MDNLGIKTTIYDLIGYILPGLLLLVGGFEVYTARDVRDILALGAMDVGIGGAALLVAASYVVGHILSSISSLLFENRPCGAALDRIYGIRHGDYGPALRTRLQPGVPHDFRTAVGYCLQTHPQVYGTAMVFLSIYGFSRSASLAGTLLYVLATTRFDLPPVLHLVVIASIVALIHNYLRFKRNYTLQVYGALALPACERS